MPFEFTRYGDSKIHVDDMDDMECNDLVDYYDGRTDHHDNYNFLYVAPPDADGAAALGGATRTLAAGVSSSYDNYLSSINSGAQACEQQMECIYDGDCPVGIDGGGTCPKFELDVDDQCTLGQCSGCDMRTQPCTKAQTYETTNFDVACPAAYDSDVISHTNLAAAETLTNNDAQCYAKDRAAEAGFGFSYCGNFGTFSMCDQCLTCKGKKSKEEAEQKAAAATRSSRAGRRLGTDSDAHGDDVFSERVEVARGDPGGPYFRLLLSAQDRTEGGEPLVVALW